ncbi:MAG: replication initiation factor domain-containing protein, partial [Rhizobacter sp.]|nr:replication initiation factor domain-containing protein [Rhizobacter sp.]
MASRGNKSSKFDEGAHAGAGRAAEPPHRDGGGATEGAPRLVTTGGKGEAQRTERPCHTPKGIDEDTGEPFEVFAAGPRHVKVVRHLTPDAAAMPHTAHVDALAFTVVPPNAEAMRWLVREMQAYLPIDDLKAGKGRFGFKQSIQFGNGAGLIAWGGKSQRDRVLFSILGKGCSLVQDWPAVADWMRSHRVAFKRVDLAHDDFSGEAVNIAWAVQQYESKGFNAGGRKPKHGTRGDWLSGEASTGGRTLDIGSRTSGKCCRVYEKGKQLGDPTSRWTRVEVEWHGKDRLIPLE